MGRSRTRKVDDSEILGAGRDVPAEEESQEPTYTETASVHSKQYLAEHPEAFDRPQPEHEKHNRPEEAPSKADMVRAAIADGMVSPADGVAWIKAHYGMDMAKPLWSSYVAQAKARQRKLEGGEIQPRQSRTQSQPAGIPTGFGGDVKELRALIEKLGGAEETKEMIGQLSGLIGKYGGGGLSELIDAIS